MAMQDKDNFAVTYKNVADLDAYEHIHYTMACVHEIIYRGLESILYHLENNERLNSDLDNWLGYVGAWIYFVFHHHHGEETYFFPGLKKHGHSMDTELEQHEKIHKDIDAISDVIKKYKKDKTKYSSKELKALCLECKPNLYDHLSQEVAGLTRENLETKISQKDLKAAHDYWEGTVRKEIDPLIAFPFVVYHTTNANYYWAALPRFVYFIVVPLMSLRHRGWWKYCPDPRF